jgi:glycosyltransferase involved in cell wall biosynthesis
MAKVVFYCHAKKSALSEFEYYKQDIDAIKALGHEIIICSKYREIPFNFDIIFIWWWTYALYPVLLSRFLKKPSIITGTFNFGHPIDLQGNDFLKRRFWQKYLIKKATQQCTLNLFVNKKELEKCTSYFNLTNSRFYPHVVHEDYLKGPAKKRSLSLVSITWCEKYNIIRKGIPELLQAVRLLKDEGVSIKLALAGHKGNGVDTIINMISELKIQNEVDFLGSISRERKIELLRTSEIYVQPSHFEGFGVAIAEAMGCGACIITCDVGAVRSVVGDCGIYVPHNSPKKLAEAIKNMLLDSTLRKTLQNKSYKRACNFFVAQNKINILKQYFLELNVF